LGDIGSVGLDGDIGEVRVLISETGSDGTEDLYQTVHAQPILFILL
jgi:hypothetical protein